MKHSNITRCASLVLAIGFFISCSSTKFSADNLINEGNYQQALDEITIELSKNPSASLYYQKGKVHGLMSTEKIPSERTSDYSNMITAFDSANVYSSVNESNILDKIDSLTTYYWNLEQKNGLSEYEEKTSQSLGAAIDHFSNAILIKPKNIESYKSLSIALYNNDDIEGAITTLEKAEFIADGSDKEIFENLGFLYLETGNPEKSISYYQKANQDPLKNKNIAFGLVNAYISQNRTSEAILFLDKLINEYPNEAKLHNVYGTQLYNQAFDLFSNLKQSYSNGDSTSANNLRVEIEGISDMAENQLIKAYKQESTNIEFIESLAVFYNNMSGNYFSIHEVAFMEHKEPIKDKALSLTDFAITYYTQLADSNAQEEIYSNKIENLNKLKDSWTNE